MCVKASVCVRVYALNITMAEKNNKFPGFARFNALGARETIIKFSLNREAILFFPKRYIILYILVRVYKYILFKRSETEEMPSRDPATY